ncbi:hypothetical protein [Polaribacter sp.]|uniref:hypothetical protein n=1 Tax=Polaribacter sp. TaxID=1920175 RepID=UPI003F6ACB80
MKKGILIAIAMFLMVTTVKAKENENVPTKFGVNYYSYSNAVNFFENGIEFFVFTNGDFDFDINFRNNRIRIDRDFRGRIRRIGNVRLRYDFRGNVTRIGEIRINYFRNRVRNIGDLTVRYDRWGQPMFYGNVRNFYYDNGIRFNVNFGDVFGYNDVFFRDNSFRRNYVQIREDRNFFYYRAKPNARIGGRSTIIKRRKSDTSRRNNNATARRKSTNEYRKNDANRRLSSDRSTTNLKRTEVDRNEVRRDRNLTNRKSDLKKKPAKRTVKDTRTKRRSI